MKLNKTLSMFAAVATVATGCVTAPEYKVVERVTKDGTVEKCVVEKGFMDRVNDVGNNNAGTLGLINTAANVANATGSVGTWITNIGRNDAIRDAGRSVGRSVDRNTQATKDQTSALSTIIQAGLQGLCK